MFENLSDRLQGVFKDLKGQGKLTENNISDALRQVRIALLEADVSLPVAKAFIDRVRERAVGQEVLNSLTPGQAVVGVVKEELEHLLGDENDSLNLAVRPPAVVLMAGLQGSGKTTTVAKLARFLREREKKSVVVTSADIYRPAAIDQLETLSGEVGAAFVPSQSTEDPKVIAERALEEARIRSADVVIVDTAGRLHIDEDLMEEIQGLQQTLEPAETLLVADAMTGQDAVQTAEAFNDALDLTGVVLTKTDGDARGGAALSIRHVTGKPIKFLGVGEKTEALEPFHPDRLASRILGMGDVLSLVEEAQRTADQDQAEKLEKQLKSGKGMSLADFQDQLQQIKRMGGLGSILDKLPGGEKLAGGMAGFDESQITRMDAIINSMTPWERRHSDAIKASRKRRIASGSGTSVQEVNRLLKQFAQMQKAMKQMKKKGGMKKMMAQMGGKMGDQDFPF
ncbi:signal recognition particle protein [Thiohalorhabdus methylotrophus]|uniref:Signal recognition particle protein n=1 Tax=Thiohalorhabdus methylotrophus TaxID=3242694 RepID=A0ABV4U0J1_9GAMM